MTQFILQAFWAQQPIEGMNYNISMLPTIKVDMSQFVPECLSHSYGTVI